MEFDYFYGQQAEQFSFYRIPKMLFTDDRFWNVSTDAKLLYGILLDRMNLSARNGWMDAAGRVYIIFTLEETMAALNCGDNKATKLYNELEKKCGLIERKRQGLGKPNLIYVKNFVSGVDSIVESRFKSRENHDSGVGQTPIVESGKPRGNKDLASVDELAVLDGGKCILQLRGVRPFMSDKYDLTQHPNYKYTSDYDKKNEFNIEQFLSRRLKLKANDEFEVVESE